MSNKVKVRMLKLARDRIDCGRSRYICIALMGGNLNSEERQAAYNLRTDIMVLLEGYGSLDFWLRAKGFSVTLKDKEKLKQTRLNWIDHLIKEYSNDHK